MVMTVIIDDCDDDIDNNDNEDSSSDFDGFGDCFQYLLSAWKTHTNSSTR